MRNHLVRAFAVVALATSLPAQRGDLADEPQPDLPAELVVPPAPALSPEEERGTFRLPPELAIELVAAEPLVHDPIAAVFDELGRLWVVEMRAFMPDVDGTGERAPQGTIAVLYDRDGDGRMDERRTFLGGLSLPRAVAPTRRGALVIAPPDLLDCQDEDEDGVADRVERIDTIGSSGLESPEHAVNGLIFGADGAFHCANHAFQYRYDGQDWLRERTAGGGQWGLTRDDSGRFLYNTNSDPLRGDLYPSNYAIRNPNAGTAYGVNLRFAKDFRVWPSRVTPGVNRGYRKETLREDYTLATVTAACAPLVLRGDALEAEWRGNAYICEPAGNLVKRYLLKEGADGGITAENAWEGREFLTSTDERFRPVNLCDGPDGALYVVDMYRGLIQHKVFVTSFLRRQVLARALDEPRGLGRIWRIRPQGWQRPTPPTTADASWEELLELLGSPNGFWRDAVQRLFVEEGRGDGDALAVLHEALRDPSSSPRQRLHAWWALTALEETRREELAAGLADPDLDVRMAAVRACEPWLARGDAALTTRLIEVARGAERRLLWQVLQSLGQARTTFTDAALASLLREGCERAEECSIALSGLGGRELDFLGLLLQSEDWSTSSPGRSQLLAALARCIVVENQSERIERLLDAIASLPPERSWQAEVLLVGIQAGRGRDALGQPAPIPLARRPFALGRLEQNPAEGVRARYADLLAALRWPGRADVPPEQVVRPLTDEEQLSFELGRFHYANVCATCHQPSGRGEPGKAPSLRGSEWVLGPPERLASLVLAGLQGPLAIEGEIWSMEMPAFAEKDEIVAGVLTYIRREWGHGAEPLDLATLHAARERAHTRGRPWTVEELRAAYP